MSPSSFSDPSPADSREPTATARSSRPSASVTSRQALAAAQQSIALSDAYPQGHTVLGWVYLWQKQYEQATAEQERTVTLDPNLADGYASLAEVLSRVGKPDEAVGIVEQALHLKPHALKRRSGRGTAPATPPAPDLPFVEVSLGAPRAATTEVELQRLR